MTKHDMGQFPLPPDQRNELHDAIALALDSIETTPSECNLAEARSYLRHALEMIGSAA